MKKNIIPLTIFVILVFVSWTNAISDAKDLFIQGKKLISNKPPFTLNLPFEFRLIHSFSQDNPKENSLTRAYFFIKEKDRKIEELFIVQIADKTNPQAQPMTTPPLKPYTEGRMYMKDKLRKGELIVHYLVQLMAWNPNAPSLQPIIKKGIIIPHQWSIQGQLLFIYLGDHGVSIRYSKDVNSFGFNVSKDGKDWGKESISGNEKRVFEIFRKTFMDMIKSITIINQN
jgi:hypothetical protein